MRRWNIQEGTGCVQEEVRKLQECNTEQFGILESSDKTIAILGDIDGHRRRKRTRIG